MTRGGRTALSRADGGTRPRPQTALPDWPSPATAMAGRPGASRWSRPAIRCRTRPGLPAPNARWRSPTLAGADDLVLVLLSGGASANWIAPAAGLTLAEKQAVTRALLRSGADIGEINTVRKHLSRIKGGRLAAPRATGESRDARDFRRARRRSGRHRLRPDRARSDHARRCAAPSCANIALALPEAVTRALDGSGQRIAEAGRKNLRRAQLQDRGAAGRCARRRTSRAPRRPATNASSSATACRARRARSRPNTPSSPANLSAQSRRIAILSGGELTVTLRGHGRGGPNQEYALALAIALAGRQGHCRACRRYRRNRRRQRPPRRPGRRFYRRNDARTCRGGRPRSRRVSCRQRFHGVFQRHRRSVSARPDVHQRDRLPRHRR